MEVNVINNYNGPSNRRWKPADKPVRNFNPDLGPPNVYTNGDYRDMSNDEPHREMAVDCPADFPGVQKEPPRYPPPAPNSASSSMDRRERNGHHSSNPTSKQRSPTKPQTLPGLTVTHPPQQSTQEKYDQMERIKKYQEDAQKRKENEERLNREQEFLRTSLRGSKKLQALEETRNDNKVPCISYENPTFDEEEEYARGDSYDGISRASTLPKWQQGNTEALLKRKPLGTNDINNLLHHLQSKLGDVEEQKKLSVLSQIIRSQPFQNAIKAHNHVVSQAIKTPPQQPVASNSEENCSDILDTLNMRPGNTNIEEEELKSLLSNCHLQNLMLAHDKIAKQRAEPPPSLMSDDDEREFLYARASQYGEQSIKIVRLQKTADPLGATVRNENDSVVIGRIVKGGAAEKSGLLHEGDEILEINGSDIRGKNVNDVCDLMSNMTGTLTFLIIPAESLPVVPGRDDAQTHMKANYNYDPEEDLYIPCKELGISFQKGDILHIIGSEDPNWWQAYREGEEDQALAGLIPSNAFQEQRARHTIVSDGDNDSSRKKGRCACGKSHGKKKKKELFNPNGANEEIPAYEEVELYYPQPNRKRPIVLIGPSNIGLKDLVERLLQSDPDRFATAVSHTSRPKGPDEKDGQDHYFVPKQELEQGIAANKFVEFGDYDKHLYATSMAAIRENVTSGKVCILNFVPQSLYILKSPETADIKPYVVFIMPPKIDRLRQIKLHQNIRMPENELQEIIDTARNIEEVCGHFFDFIIVHMDPERTYQELLEEINRLDVEPQWIPKYWVA